jgi:Methyltransferase domain
VRLSFAERAPVATKPKVVVWTSLTPDETEALRELARGREVVEVGSAFGYSTAVLASVAAHVWAVDPHNVEPGFGNYNFPGEPPPGYEHTYERLELVLSDLKLTGRVDTCFDYSHHALAAGTPFAHHLADRVDMAFIDGDHAYLSALTDLRNCERILGPVSVMTVHDYGEDANPDVAKAVDEWRRGRPMRLVDTLAIIEL